MISNAHFILHHVALTCDFRPFEPWDWRKHKEKVRTRDPLIAECVLENQKTVVIIDGNDVLIYRRDKCVSVANLTIGHLVRPTKTED